MAFKKLMFKITTAKKMDNALRELTDLGVDDVQLMPDHEATYTAWMDDGNSMDKVNAVDGVTGAAWL